MSERSLQMHLAVVVCCCCCFLGGEEISDGTFYSAADVYLIRWVCFRHLVAPLSSVHAVIRYGYDGKIGFQGIVSERHR